MLMASLGHWSCSAYSCRVDEREHCGNGAECVDSFSFGIQARSIGHLGFLVFAWASHGSRSEGKTAVDLRLWLLYHAGRNQSWWMIDPSHKWSPRARQNLTLCADLLPSRNNCFSLLNDIVEKRRRGVVEVQLDVNCDLSELCLTRSPSPKRIRISAFAI